MPDMEGEKRPFMLIVHLLSFLALLRVALQFIMLGLFVLVGSEIYVYFSGEPKPQWLDVLETVYGKMWDGVRGVGAAAFSNTKSQTAQPNPACIVEFVQFDGAKETRRRRYYVKDLVVRLEQHPAKGADWQEVQLLNAIPASEVGWVVKSDWDAKRAQPECG